MRSQPAGTYNRVPAEGNPRQTEGWALLEAARRMQEAQRRGEEEAILTAVRLNWRLWTIFQASLVDPACGVPDGLRSNILSLSNFIDRRSAEIIGNPKPEKVSVLININLQIGGGLLASPPAAVTQPAQPATAVERVAINQQA